MMQDRLNRWRVVAEQINRYLYQDTSTEFESHNPTHNRLVRITVDWCSAPFCVRVFTCFDRCTEISSKCVILNHKIDEIFNLYLYLAFSGYNHGWEQRYG